MTFRWQAAMSEEPMAGAPMAGMHLTAAPGPGGHAVCRPAVTSGHAFVRAGGRGT